MDARPQTGGAIILRRARSEGRTILTEFESKQVLAAYGIPIAQTIIATDAAAAVKAADQIGYPVVLKLYSETITHKTDVGGVQLNLANAEAVERRLRRHPDVGDATRSARSISRASPCSP